jgi:hypothetical protein
MNWGKPSHWRERRAGRMAELKRPAAETQSGAVHVQIERLVLSGVAHRDAQAVVQAMGAELARLAAPHAPVPRGASRIDAGKITLAPTPERTGRRIGAAVHKGIWQ